MSCSYLNYKCKYDDDGHCTFAEWSGSPKPYNAPCFVGETYAKWKHVKMNPRMRMCTNCQFMVNEELIYNYTDKNPLVYKFCPSCGANMEGSET